MAVDKGGLDYPITTTYDPTGVAAFKKDIADLRKLSGDLKIGVGGGAGEAIGPSGRSRADAAVEVESIRATVAKLKAAQQELNRVRSEVQKTVRDIASSSEKTNPFGTQTLKTSFQTFDESSKRLTTSYTNTSRAASQATQSTNTYVAALGRLLVRYIAFRAILTVVRDAVGAFKEVVSEAINFNAELENSTTSISSLLVAVGTIRDSFGETLTGYRAFTAAQGIARDQMAKLRVESLKTTASFEDLVKTLQVAVAPGLRAGLNIDQVREFTVEISKAAAAVGVQQNQLAEEIRSILAGTINLRNTRIAAALGITNDDIRRAKELGNLAEFLRDRFNSFNIAAAASTNNFDIIVSNLKSGLSQLIGTGGKSLFDAIKQSVIDLRNTIIQVDKVTGEVRLNPELLDAVRAVSNSLVEVFKTLNSIGSTEGIVSGVAEVFKRIGDNISVALIQMRSFIATTPEFAKSAGRFLGDSILPSIEAKAKDLQQQIDLINRLKAGATTPQDLLEVAKRLASKSVAGNLDFGLAAATKNASSLESQLDEINKIIKDRNDLLSKKLPILGDIGAVASGQSNNPEAIKFLDTLRDKIIKVNEELKRPLGVGGASKNQFDLMIKSAEDALIHLKEFDTEQKALFEQRISLQKQLEVVELNRSKFSDDEKKAVVAGLEAAKERLSLEKALNEKKEQQAVIDGRIGDLSRDPGADKSGLIDLEAEKKKITEAVDFLQAKLDARDRASLTIPNLQSEKLIASINTELKLYAQLLSVNKDITDNKNAQADAQSRLLDLTSRQLQVAARQNIEDLKNNQGKLDDALAAARRETSTNALERAGDNRFRLQAQQDAVNNQIDALNREAETLDRIAAANKKARDLDRQKIADQLTVEQNEERRVNLQETLNLLDKQEGLEAEKTAAQRDTINAKLDDAIAKMQELNFIQNQPVTAGITLAIRDLNKDLPTVFEGVHKITTDFVNGLSTTIADTIVDAFDPTNKKDLRQRFSEFLRGIAAEMIKMLVQVAVVKSTLAIFGGALGGFNEGGAVGLNTGGRVRPGGRAGSAHAFAQGRAGGGPASFRPKGLHPSDTVPIWAAVGEWVIQARSVAKYGHDVMSNINAGFVDRDDLRAVAKQKQGYVPPAKGPGFASGGRIGPATASPTAASAPGVSIAVMAPSEDAMERFLRGGKNAQFRFMEDNAAQIRALLGV